jgi:hypothetical protein
MLEQRHPLRGDTTMATVASTPETQAVTSRTGSEWLRLLAWLTGVVAFVDLVFIVLVREVIPPLVVGAVLTAIGIALVRRLPRSATVVLGLTSLLMLVGALQFGAEHLSHPSSGIDFSHAVIGIVGRIVAIAAAVMALRRAVGTGTRRVATASVGALAATLVVAAVATVATSGEAAEAGDVETAIIDHDFADRIEVLSGDTLFVDNREPFRHTFTVEDTSLDVVVPASQAVRIPIDLPPGTYDVICAVPGHESMHTTLSVR